MLWCGVVLCGLVLCCVRVVACSLALFVMYGVGLCRVVCCNCLHWFDLYRGVLCCVVMRVVLCCVVLCRVVSCCVVL